MSTPTRAGRILGYDGQLAAWLLLIWQVFLASTSFVALCVPLVVFQAAVGWQPTHLAIALFSITALPLVPGAYALLIATARILDHGATADAGRAFWRGFVTGARQLRGIAACAGGAVALLSYDVAIVGDAPALQIAASVAAALLVALLIAICVTATGTAASGLALTTAACRAAARRPHIVLSWLMLLALGSAATAIPVLGTSLMIFAPALIALGIHICNRALRFDADRIEQEHT